MDGFADFRKTMKNKIDADRLRTTFHSVSVPLCALSFYKCQFILYRIVQDDNDEREEKAVSSAAVFICFPPSSAPISPCAPFSPVWLPNFYFAVQQFSENTGHAADMRRQIGKDCLAVFSGLG